MSIFEKAGDGLYLSVSQLKTYLKCPRQYELRYVRGAPPEFVPVALVFGVAFHAALSRFYAALKETGEVLPVWELVETFRGEWEVKANDDVPLQQSDDDETKADPLDLAAKMLGKFHEHAADTPVQVKAVEQPFAVTLYDADTGEVQEEKLVGVIDLVLEEDGHPVVVEHKTSAKKYGADQLRYDFQPTAYQLALREEGWNEVGLRYQIITKTKVPAVQVEDVVRGREDEDDFRRVAVGVLRAVDAGAFYPMRGWQCRGCPFRSECG